MQDWYPPQQQWYPPAPQPWYDPPQHQYYTRFPSQPIQRRPPQYHRAQTQPQATQPSVLQRPQPKPQPASSSQTSTKSSSVSSEQTTGSNMSSWQPRRNYIPDDYAHGSPLAGRTMSGGALPRMDYRAALVRPPPRYDLQSTASAEVYRVQAPPPPFHETLSHWEKSSGHEYSDSEVRDLLRYVPLQTLGSARAARVTRTSSRVTFAEPVASTAPARIHTTRRKSV